MLSTCRGRILQERDASGVGPTQTYPCSPGKADGSDHVLLDLLEAEAWLERCVCEWTSPWLLHDHTVVVVMTTSSFTILKWFSKVHLLGLLIGHVHNTLGIDSQLSSCRTGIDWDDKILLHLIYHMCTCSFSANRHYCKHEYQLGCF